MQNFNFEVRSERKNMVKEAVERTGGVGEILAVLSQIKEGSDDRHESVADALIKMVRMLAGEGSLPLNVPSPSSERRQYLKELHNIQVGRLLERGFHGILGMTEDDYRASLPDYLMRPMGGEYYDHPVIIDPRVSLQQQLKMLNIDLYSWDVSQIIMNLTDRPKTPYTAWLHVQSYGELHYPIEAKGVLDKIGSTRSEEESATLADVVGLRLIHPEKYPHGYAIYAPGSRWGRGIPCITQGSGSRERYLNASDPDGSIGYRCSVLYIATASPNIGLASVK